MFAEPFSTAAEIAYVPPVATPPDVLNNSTSVEAMYEFVSRKLTAAPAARDAAFSVICPVGAFSVTPVALEVAWVTAPPAPAVYPFRVKGWTCELELMSNAMFVSPFRSSCPHLSPKLIVQRRPGNLHVEPQDLDVRVDVGHLLHADGDAGLVVGHR